MMNRGIAVQYGDIAIGAKEAFKATMEDKTDFSDLSVLNQNGVFFPNYVNPCERYSVLLDGGGLPLPKEPNGKSFGIWSDVISDVQGVFEAPLVLRLDSAELYTSSGITVNFDTENKIFPKKVNVKWLRFGEIIEEQEFQVDSASYFFNRKVERYDGVVFEFLEMNMPYNRLKIHSIEYGIGVIFYGDELTSSNIIQSINPISSQIEINTFDFSVKSKRNVAFSFQSQQPVSVYFNGKLKATCFVKSASKKAKNIWDIKTEDYIGVMGTTPYYGGIFNEHNAFELLKDIFETAKVPYTIAEEFSFAEVNGYIPFTNCRDALMQVCFAVGAVVSTANRADVCVYKSSNEVTQKIDNGRIFQGVSEKERKIVTSVEVVAHNYTPIDEEVSLYETSEAENEVFIKFNQPIHDLTIDNGDILDSGYNYAIINANGVNCKLIGHTYKHTTIVKRKNNPLVSMSDSENIVLVDKATLVTNKNVDNILDLCYNYIVNKKEISLTIIDGKHIIYGKPIKYGSGRKYGTFVYGQKEKNEVIFDIETNVGDVITISPEFIGDRQGFIERQDYKLIGNVIAKKTMLG